MQRNLLIVAGVIIIVLAIIFGSAAFVVHQTEQAIVLQFGDPKRVIQKPGLHFKIPFIQNVVFFDARILDYAPPQEEIIAADQKRLVVDSFARYRIADPLEFYKAVGTELSARARLAGIMSASLRRVVGNETLASVLSEERNNIMQRIKVDTNEAASKFGLDVVDVRIRRADLPQANADAIYQRMQSEREREAREFRAQGAEIAQRIRARAERERTVLIAESNRQSQILRGEGDADAIKIYADAFGKDPEFFSFYRSMEAYRNALKPDGTTMVLSPDSDFFSYFKGLSSGVSLSPLPPDISGSGQGQAPNASDGTTGSQPATQGQGSASQ
jgi:modulator of FtsH protease HflC